MVSLFTSYVAFSFQQSMANTHLACFSHCIRAFLFRRKEISSSLKLAREGPLIMKERSARQEKIQEPSKGRGMKGDVSIRIPKHARKSVQAAGKPDKTEGENRNNGLKKGAVGKNVAEDAANNDTLLADLGRNAARSPRNAQDYMQHSIRHSEENDMPVGSIQPGFLQPASGKESSAAPATAGLGEDASNLLLLKNGAKRFDDKISPPMMSKEKSQSLRVEQPIQDGCEENGLKLSCGRQEEAGRGLGMPCSPQYTGSQYSHGRLNEEEDRSVKEQEEELPAGLDTHGSPVRSAYAQYPKKHQQGGYAEKEEAREREELLAELRNIARMEAKSLQELPEKTEETYFHPPASPSRHPLEYLREVYQMENRLSEYMEPKPRHRRQERELSDSSAVEVDSSGFKSFNDFDEGIFKFDPNTKLFNCPWEDCDKAFPSLSRIKRHYIIHTDIKPFKCLNPGCNRRFSRKDNMYQHYRVHCPFASHSHKHS